MLRRVGPGSPAAEVYQVAETENSTVPQLEEGDAGTAEPMPAAEKALPQLDQGRIPSAWSGGSSPGCARSCERRRVPASVFSGCEPPRLIRNRLRTQHVLPRVGLPLLRPCLLTRFACSVLNRLCKLYVIRSNQIRLRVCYKSPWRANERVAPLIECQCHFPSLRSWFPSWVI